MKKSEITDLLALAYAIDGRIPDEAAATAWHDALIDMDFRDARMALASTRQQIDIRYVEPRHIVEHHRILKARREHDSRLDEVRRAVGTFPGNAYEGFRKPWKHTPAPRPANMAAMEAAYDSGDQQAVNREVNLYRGQVADDGIMSDFDAAPIQNRATRRAARTP